MHITGVNTAIRLSDPVGLLAARDAGVRDAFESLGIDYYCAGDLTLDDAARGAGMDPFSVRARLEQSERGSGTAWDERSMRDLVTHLEHEHHQLLRSIIFHSAMLFDDVASVYGTECVQTMRRLFRELSKLLILHVEKEEHTLFPLLLSLEDAWLESDPSLAPDSHLHPAIARLVIEHASIAAKLAELRGAGISIEESPAEACRRLRDSLVELERHVHESLNLENYVVFPRALALEDDV
ncbi:MAG TPA: DUF542 domain-containing protein, partial [Thermoanaerobaculia bacterium]|nr:DUF542 domain-containing protein [Thermoanaerobaculia bacterium]